MQRREDRGRQVFERLCHGQKTRREQAVVALSRKILVWCRAMLRDGTEWNDPAAAATAEPVPAAV
jgi:hypothetical protein